MTRFILAIVASVALGAVPVAGQHGPKPQAAKPQAAKPQVTKAHSAVKTTAGGGAQAKPPKPSVAKPTAAKPVKSSPPVKGPKTDVAAAKASKPAKSTTTVKAETKKAETKKADTKKADANKADAKKATTRTATTTSPTGTVTLTPVQQKLEKNTNLAAKLQSRLPAGTNLMTAADGFRNLGQFVAAVNVSNNLGIPFADLKRQMVTENKSLGQSIQALRPVSSATIEAQHGEAQARFMINESEREPMAPVKTATKPKAKPRTSSGATQN